MLSRSLCVASLVLILAAGAGYLVAAGTLPWPAVFLILALALVLFGVAMCRNRPRPRVPLQDDTEPAGFKPPPG